jgi:hypothetical protein
MWRALWTRCACRTAFDVDVLVEDDAALVVPVVPVVPVGPVGPVPIPGQDAA